MRCLIPSILAVFSSMAVLAQSPPGDATAQSYVGKNKKDLDQAILDLGHSIQQTPNDPLNYYARGCAEHEAAKIEYAIVRAAGADHPATTEEMEAYKESRRHLESAIADFSRAINLNPKYGSAYLQRGLVEWELKDVSGNLDFSKSAKADIQKALEIDPRNSEAEKGLAGIEYDRKKAIEDYTKVIELNPGDAWAYFFRARIEGWNGMYPEATRDFSAAIRMNPKEVSFYRQRAEMEMMLAQSGSTNWEVPLPNLNEEITLKPDDALALVDRAFLRERTGDWEGALQDWNRVLQINPDSISLCRRGYVKHQLGDVEGALADFNKAIQTEPQLFLGYYCRAAIEQSKGDLVDALSDMHTSLQKEPTEGEYANLHIWIIEMLQNNKAGADQELSDYLARKPIMYNDNWIQKIANFFLGRMTEAEFLRAAKQPDRLDDGREWEGWFYAGYKRSVSGDKTTADKYFHTSAILRKKDDKDLLTSVQLENLGKSIGGL